MIKFRTPDEWIEYLDGQSDGPLDQKTARLVRKSWEKGEASAREEARESGPSHSALEDALREQNRAQALLIDSMKLNEAGLRLQLKAMMKALRAAKKGMDLNNYDLNGCTDTEIEDFDKGVQLMEEIIEQEKAKADPLDRFPKPHQGYERSWVACKTCGNIAYYDYIPYGLGNPVLTLPCGHQGGQGFNEATVKVSEDQARDFYYWKDQEKSQA